MRVKLIQSVFVFFLASVLASSAAAFQVYIQSDFVNQPNFATYGIKDPAMFYGGKVFGSKAESKFLPSESKTRSYVQAKFGTHTGLLVIDFEGWPVGGSDAAVATSVAKYKTVLKWVKDETPATVGYYSKPPVPVYSAVQRGTTDPRYLKWQKKNDRLQELADAVDVFFPGCYPNNADQNGWVRKCVALINESRRLGDPRKEVFPFIKPRYHNNAANGLANDPVPKDYFLLQLKTLKNPPDGSRGADGVIIWDGSRLPWNEQAPWWQATLEFLGKK